MMELQAQRAREIAGASSRSNSIRVYAAALAVAQQGAPLAEPHLSELKAMLEDMRAQREDMRAGTAGRMAVDARRQGREDRRRRVNDVAAGAAVLIRGARDSRRTLRITSRRRHRLWIADQTSPYTYWFAQNPCIARDAPA